MDWKEKTRLVQKDPVICSRYFDNRVQQFIKIVLKSNHHPIGKITDYFYSVEFQHRGPPLSSLIWVEKAPKYKFDSDEILVDFINKYVSFKRIKEFRDLVTLQTHKHSKIMQKKVNQCANLVSLYHHWKRP